jgi:hypothetical protein
MVRGCSGRWDLAWRRKLLHRAAQAFLDLLQEQPGRDSSRLRYLRGSFRSAEFAVVGSPHSMPDPLPELPVMPQVQSPPEGTVLQGLGYSFACQLAVVALAWGLGTDAAIFGIGLWGLFQWLPAIPWIIKLKKGGRHGTVRGMLILSTIGLAMNLCGLYYFFFMLKLKFCC